MRKKGFTLIELLAVIVILAIIAVIAVPTVLNIIEKSKKNAFKDSVYGLMEAADLFLVSENYNSSETLRFVCDGITCKLSDGRSLQVKGKVPNKGSINVSNNEVEAYYIQSDGYCALGTKGNLDIKKDCDKLDITKPSLTLNLVSTSSNSATVSMNTSDIESGIKSIEYLLNDESKDKKTKKQVTQVEENYTFEKLEKNKEYQIKVIVINGNNLMIEETINVKTHDITNPSITYTNTPSSVQNGYLKSQTANITFSRDNITSPSHYIKTTREGTSNLNITESCGTDTEPSTCTSITSTTTLETNTWYKVSENVDVTYDEASSETGTIYVLTYDGTNYSGATTGTINKIDTTSPTITNIDVIQKTNNMIITYKMDDKESGLGTATCSYGITSGTYDGDENKVTVTTNSCAITGLTQDSTYYYKICITDLVGNEETCHEGNSNTLLVQNPSITYTNTPTTAINGYLTSQVAKVTYNNSNITSPSYYVKTTRAGTSSLNITESCGTDTEPGSCTSIESTKNLSTNTWYKVSGNVNVTYSSPSDTTGTIYAITYDGTNYSGAATGTISKIAQPAESISLNKTSASIEKGGTLQLNATINPSNTTDKTISWTSSDDSVATVDSDGLVTAKGAGSATITATTSNDIKATSNITVVISPTGVSISPNGGRVKVNGTLQLTANISPSDATANKTVTWTSDDDTVATVDKDGLVTGKKVGNVTITAETANGKTSSVNITVTDTLVVTRSILDQGKFLNVTPTYLTNQVDGSVGFTITGTASNNTYGVNCENVYPYEQYYLRWDYEIDLTNYNTISFYAKKNAGHGSAQVTVNDGLKYSCYANSGTKYYAGGGANYTGLPTSWTKYTLDVSGVTGKHIVSFVGGYYDPSGSPSSSTSFCNIKFE